MPRPILLDTDIGTDIDDAYALILAAVSPELELKAVTTVNHDVELRARIAKRLLILMQRSDAPVALGSRSALTSGVSRGWEGHEGRGIELGSIVPERDFDPRPAHRVMADLAREGDSAGEPLTIVTIGALTNLALALREHPAEMQRVRRVIAMASNFAGFGEAYAKGEHNVACDPIALGEVLASGLPLTLIGLNVTNQTCMRASDLERVEAIGGPLAEALSGMHRVWFQFVHRDASPMHDGLAVAAAFRPDLITVEPVTARLVEEPITRGAVVYERETAARTGPTEIAVAVDADAFHRLLYGRVDAAVAAAAAAAQRPA